MFAIVRASRIAFFCSFFSSLSHCLPFFGSVNCCIFVFVLQPHWKYAKRNVVTLFCMAHRLYIIIKRHRLYDSIFIKYSTYSYVSSRINAKLHFSFKLIIFNRLFVTICYLWVSHYNYLAHYRMSHSECVKILIECAKMVTSFLAKSHQSPELTNMSKKTINLTPFLTLASFIIYQI